MSRFAAVAAFLLLLVSPGGTSALAAPDAPATSSSAIPLWGTLEPGPHAVGFQVIETFDDSRSWRPERAPDGRVIPGPSARPVRISVWYPAGAAGPAPMRYGDYVHIAGSGVFGELNAVLAQRELNLLRRIMRGRSAVAHLMRSPSAALRDAPPATGRFPLIGYTPGLNAYLQHGNFVLCEYLASHGYVVVTVPQLGTTSMRLEFGIDPVSLETQMRDTEFALAAVRRLPFADQDKVALIGHSMGGVSSVISAMRDSRVDAVVGLDASNGARQLAPTLTGSAFYTVRNLRVPWLDLRRAANDELDSSSLSALEHADRYQLLFSGVAHSDFTSFPMIAMNFPTDIAGRTPAHASRVYELVARTLLAFLDATFATHGDIDQALRAAAAPETHAGLVEQFVHLPPRPVPLSGEELAFLIARDGLAATLAARPHAADKALLNAAGYRLLEWQRMDRAIETFRRNVRLHPGDSNLLDSLAEGYLSAGRLREAAAAYRDVLQASPGDRSLDESSREALRSNAQAKLSLIAEMRSWNATPAPR
ncbi:MAG TPA: hypothetical protein VGX37_03785 [Allosphingosinicella sp.]|nr:hypothetical protein [Allosphingosinicella sp.]